MTPDDAFKALELALNTALLGRGVTVSNVQRSYRLGYSDAQRLMDLRDTCFDQLDMLASLRAAPTPLEQRVDTAVAFVAGAHSGREYERERAAPAPPNAPPADREATARQEAEQKLTALSVGEPVLRPEQWDACAALTAERDALRTALTATLDEFADLVGMRLSHFIVGPAQNTRRENIECVEYWPITEWIAQKRTILRGSAASEAK